MKLYEYEPATSFGCGHYEEVEAILIPDNATNYDALKAIFGSITAFRIKDAMEFEEGFETWFFEPYKEIER